MLLEFSYVQNDKHRVDSRCVSLKAAPRVPLDTSCLSPHALLSNSSLLSAIYILALAVLFPKREREGKGNASNQVTRNSRGGVR
jgi:hypothetical protein